MLRKPAIIAAFCLMVVSGVWADTLTVGTPVTGYALPIYDSSVGSVTAAIDPYHGTLTIASNPLSVLLYCIDPNHFDKSGAYSINSSSDNTGFAGTNQSLNGLSLAATNAGFTNAADLYGGLAWLSSQINTLYTQGASTELAQQEYQAAIWTLADYTNTFTVTSPPSGFSSSYVTTLEQNAYTNRKALSGQFTILTDSSETKACAASTCSQEYLILTPEPSGFALFGSGLLGLLGVLKKRRGSTAE